MRQSLGDARKDEAVDQMKGTELLIVGMFRVFVAVAAITSGNASAADAKSAQAAHNEYPLQPVRFASVRLQDGFWSDRLETNRDITIPHNLRELEKQGSLSGFMVLAGDQSQTYRGWMWGDSDVYKTIEGMANCLRTHPDQQREEQLERIVRLIVGSQASDGYLAPHLQLAEPQYRHFADETTRTSESYNLGHLIESAVAHFETTGRRNYLQAAIKCADLLARVQSEGELEQVAGHGEIELALVRLFRATNDPKYLAVAARYVRNAKTISTSYSAGRPFLDGDEAIGHVVAAGYLYCGATDVAVLEGDKDLLALLDRKWQNIVSKKLYLNGGAGLPGTEAFGAEYDLPNGRAYCETCASIALVLWNHRMFLATGDGKYLDVLERTLSNGVLAGIGRSGDRFFYANPLTVSDGSFRAWLRGTGGPRPPLPTSGYQRSPWFGCPCCPVNIVRFLPQVPGLVYATDGTNLNVNLYAAGTGSIPLAGQTVTVTQTTRYPWDGRVHIALAPERPAIFVIGLRIPGWATGHPVPSDLYTYADHDRAQQTQPELTVNGQPTHWEVKQGFAQLQREWQAGDYIELVLPMSVRRVFAHPAVSENTGRVALERGPLVYCVEAADNGGGARNLILPDTSEIVERWYADLLGGVTVLEAQARSLAPDPQARRITQPATLRAIPYCLWGHREPGEMSVWIARESQTATPLAPPPPDTIAGRARASASHCWHSDTISGLNDGIVPINSHDLEPPRLTWWDRRGTEEWAQYEFPHPAMVSAVEVYWFDDSDTGGCRAPQSWRLFYLDDGQWRPVPGGSDYGVRLDVFNRVSFPPLRASGLRIVTQLQPGFSAGIVEWRVTDEEAAGIR